MNSGFFMNEFFGNTREIFPSTAGNPSSILLSLVLIGTSLVLLNPQSSQAKRSRPQEPLAVFDSHATKVGIIHGEYNNNAASLWVTVMLKGYPAVLQVTRDALKAPDNVEALYLSLDCSGDPFFKHSQMTRGNTRIPLIFIAPPGQTVYVSAQTESSIFIAPQSRRRVGESCESLPPGPRLKLRPGRRLADLGTLYTPPFTIR